MHVSLDEIQPTQAGTAKAALTIGMWLGSLILLAGVIFWMNRVVEKTPAGQTRQLVVQTARPQVKVFKVEAPARKLSRIIPVLPRHCLDWDAVPPHSMADVEVYLDGKLYEGGYPNSRSARFKSKLSTSIPVTLIQRPMPCGRRQA